jgi:exonuclease SbcD
MIKLLHLADLHIGIENYGRLDPASGLHTRLLDYLAALDAAIDLALAEGVHLVLIAGDIYKNRSPNPTHQREFARRLNRLRDARIPVFVLTGNHDISPSMGRASSVEIFHALDVPGVTVAERPAAHRLDTTAGPLNIVALPWITRQSLLTRDEMRMISFSEIDALLRQRIEQFVNHALDTLDPELPTVLTLHGSIEGATYGAERNMTLGQDMVLSRSVVARPGIDYVALGHIHRHQQLGTHPPIVYPGSIERVDFGERQEAKGCVLVELERGAATWRFAPLPARPFVLIEVDVRRHSDPPARIAAAIANHGDLQRAVVRLEVTATREQAAALPDDALRQPLEAAQPYLIAGASVQVERETRRRLAESEDEITRGLTPRRALDLYFQSKELDPERIALLLAAADELLAEGDE